MLSEAENYTTRPAADGKTTDIINQKGHRVATTATTDANRTVSDLKSGKLSVPGTNSNQQAQPNQKMNEVEDDMLGGLNEFAPWGSGGDDDDDEWIQRKAKSILNHVKKQPGMNLVTDLKIGYSFNTKTFQITGKHKNFDQTYEWRYVYHSGDKEKGIKPGWYPHDSMDTDSPYPKDTFTTVNIYEQGMTESKLNEKAVSKSQQQAAGAALAAKRGDAPKSKLKGASKEMAKMPTKELEKFAKTKHKGLPEKKEKTDEAALPTHDGDFGAGLGAGRNSKTLESKKSKPDFLDKDGNKKESMKKAAADKQKVSTMKKTNDVKKTGKLRESIDVELGTPEHKVIMDLINGNLDAYDVMNHPRTSAQKNVADMMQDRYDDITTEYPLLHPDDDFEDILYKLVDELADDYDTSGYSQSMNEAKKAKPDFPDIDGDGDEKESMKKAAADKKKTGSADKKSSAGLTAAQKKLPAGLQKAVAKKKAVKEGANPTEAARLLGKAHAMGKDPFACKYEAGTPEAQAYLDGYKEGLDECYGSGGDMGMQQDIGMMPGMDSMVSQDSMMDSPSPRGGSEFAFGGFDEVSDDDMMAFESWDRELNALLNEGKMKEIDIDMKEMSDAQFKKEHGKSKADMKKELSGDAKKPVKEGISVSVSKGQQGSPDSVTVSAQDSDADALLAMIKQAGLGLFGGDEPSGYGSPVSAATQPIGDVGDHDSMMALIKKMSSTGNDYEDEESQDDQHAHGHPDAACDNCGSATCEGGSCSSSSKETMMGEVQTPDQMEFEVAEDSAGQDEEEMTTADEDSEAKEDQALATADANSDDEEEINEGQMKRMAYDKAESMDKEEYISWAADNGMDRSEAIEFWNNVNDDDEKLNEWANDAGYTGSENTKDNTFEQDIEFMTRIISGGLNGPKKDQTTLPHTRVKVDESRQAINDWKKLSGIK